MLAVLRYRTERRRRGLRNLPGKRDGAVSAAVSLTPAELAGAKRARDTVIDAARKDPATCAQWILRHEKTNRRIRLAPMHEEWHDLWTAEKRLIIWSHVEAGKTTQAIARLAWEIGRNVNGRFAIVGISQGAAAKVVGSISRYLESPQYREIFPQVKRGTKWTKTEITVQRPVFSKDPTLQAIGVRGHPVGARLDGILLDDVLDHLSTRTPEQRKETLTWYLSELVGRLTEDAFVWVIGNAYYSDDLLHELAAKHGFRWRRYPVANDNGDPYFPAEWSRERIRKKAEELGGEGSVEAKRQLYCVARSDESSRVKQEWIDRCLARGEGLGLVDRITPEILAELSDAENGVPATTHTGVDIGVGKKKKSAKTVIYTVLRWPNGDLQIVGLKAGRWNAGEIVANVLGEQERFCSTVAVESNGAQKFLLDNAYALDPGSEMFVLPHHTGSNKHHPVFGVESTFVDLARGKLVIPSELVPDGSRLVGATDSIKEFIGDLLDYTPDAHTSDFIMAAWFARENARLLHAGREAKRPTYGIRVLGAAEPAEPDPDAPVDEELEAWSPILKRRRTHRA